MPDRTLIVVVTAWAVLSFAGSPRVLAQPAADKRAPDLTVEELSKKREAYIGRTVRVLAVRGKLEWPWTLAHLEPATETPRLEATVADIRQHPVTAFEKPPVEGKTLTIDGVPQWGKAVARIEEY